MRSPTLVPPPPFSVLAPAMYRRPSLLGAAALVSLAAAAAQDTTVAFTDPNTGIDFQAFSDSNLGYQFGIALPETITTDFIGQLVGHRYTLV